MKMKMRRAINRAVEIAGGQTAMGRMIGVSQRAVEQWCISAVPVRRVLAVEAAVCGAVTRHELRPDIYPSPRAAT